MFWTIYFPQGNCCDIRTTHTCSTIHKYANVKQYSHPAGGPVNIHRNATTSILTTATLIYAIGAGITAAAGTRLALQSILVKHVKSDSCQLHNISAMYCYLLSLPPWIRIGDVRLFTM